MTERPASVAVVGAGVLGVTVGLALLARGVAVTLVDPRPPGTATSRGNAGCFATADTTPISMPGLVRAVPRMLADPLGPLSIRWRNLPGLAPWLWRFWRAGTPAQVEHATAALQGIAGRLWEDWGAVLDDTGLGAMVVRRGALFVYRSPAKHAAAGAEWEIRIRHGAAAVAVGAGEIHDLEPALSPGFHAGWFVRDWGHTVDPAALVGQLAAAFRQRGGQVVQDTVAGFVPGPHGPAGVRLQGGQTLASDAVVVAAGAWSAPLVRLAGHRVSLDTERGYNTTLPDPQVALTRPVCVAEDSFVMTPMAMGLRIGGAVELASLSAPPNYARSKALLALGSRALPGLNTADGTEWMGCRPSTPDSLPVIGRSGRHRSLSFAFGHGHLGLTQAATTAQLVASEMCGELVPLDLAPFRVERFGA